MHDRQSSIGKKKYCKLQIQTLLSLSPEWSLASCEDTDKSLNSLRIQFLHPQNGAVIIEFMVVVSIEKYEVSGISLGT